MQPSTPRSNRYSATPRSYLRKAADRTEENRLRAGDGLPVPCMPAGYVDRIPACPSPAHFNPASRCRTVTNRPSPSPKYKHCLYRCDEVLQVTPVVTAVTAMGHRATGSCTPSDAQREGCPCTSEYVHPCIVAPTTRTCACVGRGVLAAHQL